MCSRNGWSIESDWGQLSQWEQNEWLARDLWLRRQLDSLADGMTKREGLYTPEVHAMLILARL